MKDSNAKSNGKKKKKDSANGKRIIDLTSYISPDMVRSDVNGSYTGTTADTYYNEEYETPVQDSDDL